MVVISSTIVNINLSKWKKRTVIDWDVSYYYAYLPAIFIEKDIELKFVDNNPDYYTQNHMYLPIKCENGNYIIKTSMGMSVMYLPFFAMAHIAANIFGYETNGFSEPYQCMIQFSGLFYLILGLWYLRKILLSFFNERIAAATIFCLVFGTNLFFYGSVHGAMAHACDFMLCSLFIYQGIKWINNANYNTTVKIGLIGGMLVLIRPINILFFIFICLYKVMSLSHLVERLKWLTANYLKVIIVGLIAFLFFLPQMLYWKHITGNFLYNSYVGEKFYFTHPHLLEGLFGFRKGWLLYTPIMIFSMVGMVLLFKKHKDFAWAISVVFIVYVYVVLSWWCWWYGGSWGLRAIIDIYPFLAIAIAAFIEHNCNKGLMRKRIVTGVLIVLIVWNLFQTLQYRWGIIHYDGMTKEAYIDALFRLEKSPDLEKLIKTPDYDKARAGEE